MNKNSKHRQLFRWVYTLLTVGVTVFIFTNSLQGGEASGLRSVMVTEWLNRLIGYLGIDYRFTVYAVRKLAHLTELYAARAFPYFDIACVHPESDAAYLVAVICRTVHGCLRRDHPTLRSRSRTFVARCLDRFCRICHRTLYRSFSYASGTPSPQAGAQASEVETVQNGSYISDEDYS